MQDHKQFELPPELRSSLPTRLKLLAGLCVLALIPQTVAIPHADAARRSGSLAMPHVRQIAERDLEKLVVQAMREVSESRFNDALATVDQALAINPNFKLAHVVRGDILMARARPITVIGGGSGAPDSVIADFQDEAKVRAQRLKETIPLDKAPANFIQFDPRQKYAVAVDTGKSRLYVFENVSGEPRYVADYYVSIGKAGPEKMREGDQKTPLGIYFVTSFLPDNQLDDFYGPGAYPINYPNEWDKRQGKNGHGIWLHGVPKDTYSRAPRSSNGCVVLTNPDFVTLGKHIQTGLTPVVIAEKLEWKDGSDARTRRQALNETLEQWRNDWQSRNTAAYLRHYSKEFSAPGQDIRSWSEQKQRVNENKTWVKVNISNVSMFSQPGDDNLVVVTYDQDYKSNNLENHMKKRQYWQWEQGSWRIIYEGAA
jgi:murein L,D-transpeptidase YafK